MHKGFAVLNCQASKIIYSCHNENICSYSNYSPKFMMIENGESFFFFFFEVSENVEVLGHKSWQTFLNLEMEW